MGGRDREIPQLSSKNLQLGGTGGGEGGVDLKIEIQSHLKENKEDSNVKSTFVCDAPYFHYKFDYLI